MSKNTSVKRNNKNHQRGLDCELRVVKHLQQQHYDIRFQRLRTPYAEVDLLLEASDHFLMVEVKSVSSLFFMSAKVSPKQKARLLRAHEYLQAQLSKPLQVALALVTDDELHIFEEILG